MRGKKPGRASNAANTGNSARDKLIELGKQKGFVTYDEIEDSDPLVHIEWLTRPYNETEPDWPWTDGLRHLVECIRRGAFDYVPKPFEWEHLERVVGAALTAGSLRGG